MPQPANENSPRESIARRPLRFFVLVVVLSIPFWLAGAATNIVLLPGIPLGALMAVCPALAASILLYRDRGIGSVAALLARAFDFGRIRAKIWYLPAILLMPAIMLMSCIALRATGAQIPELPFEPLKASALFAAFFASALGEELGWSGYATDPLQEKWNALSAALVIGLFWAAWHIVPLLQVHRPAAWIMWWGLGTVSQRVLMVWLYNNTGRSVFAVALFHTMANMSMLLYPQLYDPRIVSPLLAVAALVVVLVWGPRTLARWRDM